MPKIQIKRGTRAQLDSSAGLAGLSVGEPYLITDESLLAVGLNTTSYAVFITQSVADGGRADTVFGTGAMVVNGGIA